MSGTLSQGGYAVLVTEVGPPVSVGLTVVVGEAVESVERVVDRQADVVGGGLAESLKQRAVVGVARVQPAQRLFGEFDELGFRPRVEPRVSDHGASLPRGWRFCAGASRRAGRPDGARR